MKLALFIAIHYAVISVFFLTSIGVPLYRHICLTMETSEIFSECSMHEIEPVSCCSEEDLTLPKDYADADFKAEDCCSDVEITVKIQDPYNTTAYYLSTDFTITYLPDGYPSSSISIVDDFSYKLPWLSDPSPPLSPEKYILHSSFLI